MEEYVERDVGPANLLFKHDDTRTLILNFHCEEFTTSSNNLKTSKNSKVGPQEFEILVIMLSILRYRKQMKTVKYLIRATGIYCSTCIVFPIFFFAQISKALTY